MSALDEEIMHALYAARKALADALARVPFDDARRRRWYRSAQEKVERAIGRMLGAKRS